MQKWLGHGLEFGNLVSGARGGGRLRAVCAAGAWRLRKKGLPNLHGAVADLAAPGVLTGWQAKPEAFYLGGLWGLGLYWASI